MYDIKTTDVTRDVIATGITIGVRYTLSLQHTVGPFEVKVFTVTKNIPTCITLMFRCLSLRRRKKKSTSRKTANPRKVLPFHK